MQLKDQVAIITGASSPRGIGWATARRFADEGARVVILDLDAQAAEQAARTIGHPQQDRHLGQACDVRDEGACRGAVQRVLEVTGPTPSRRAWSTPTCWSARSTTPANAASPKACRSAGLVVPADIANACLFPASDQSAYITGVVLDVSGGLHIH